MPNPVKLASQMPGEHRNGLNDIARELVKAPADQRIALVVYDVKRVETDVDREENVPTIRLLRIESPLALDRAAAWDILKRATAARVDDNGTEQLAFGDAPGE